MYVSIGKKLKLDATNGDKVSRLVRDYSDLYNFIGLIYREDLTQPVTLNYILQSMMPEYTVSYSNLPAGATFAWYSNGVPLQQTNTLREGVVVSYTLTYSDGSKCVSSFAVNGDFNLDLSTLVPNRFNLTITANKTLTEIRVYHNWSSGSSEYEVLPIRQDNIYVIECNINETVVIRSRTKGWSEVPQTPDFMNISQNRHLYTNITSNISETYDYAYESYNSVRIYLKDENNQFIDFTTDYQQYITWTPSESSKFTNPHVTQHTDGVGHSYFNAWKDKSVTASYLIEVPTYAPITGVFESQPTTEPVVIEHVKQLLEAVTLTIVPSPSDATVTLTSTGYTQSGNSITVGKGCSVTYTVSKGYYHTVTNTITVSETTALSITLDPVLFTYTINPTPSDATVTLTATGYTQSGNSISVPYGSTVNWSVSKDHYVSQSGTQIVTADTSENITLEDILYAFTIIPVPYNATVVMTAAGYTQSGNSISVPYGTSVAWTVSKTDYVTQSGTQIVSGTTNLPVNLADVLYTFTINPIPSDATVTLTATGYTQSGNSISVKRDTTVTWSVSKVGYELKSGTQLIETSDITTSVALVGKLYVDVEDYTYYGDSNMITITKYVGSGTNIIAPHLEQEI